MTICYDWIQTKNRKPESGDDNVYVLYVVDNHGDTPYDYIAVGLYLNGTWIVNNEICHDDVVAWTTLPSVNDCRDKMRNIKISLQFKIGDVVIFEDGGCIYNVLITEIFDDGVIKGLDENLEECYISNEGIKHVKNTGTQIDVKNIMDTIKSAVTK